MTIPKLSLLPAATALNHRLLEYIHTNPYCHWLLIRHWGIADIHSTQNTVIVPILGSNYFISNKTVNIEVHPCRTIHFVLRIIYFWISLHALEDL